MRRKRSGRGISAIFILIIVSVVSFLIGRLSSFPTSEQIASPLPNVTDTLVPSSPTVNAPPAFTLMPQDSPTATVLPERSLTTPADEWANMLLDILLDEEQDAESPPDGLSWWQNSESSGILRVDGRIFTVGENILAVGRVNIITISVIDPTNTTQLKQISTITLEDSLLTLNLATLSNPSRSRWLIGGTRPGTALFSLITQAELRRLRINIATSDIDDVTLQIVILDFKNIVLETTPSGPTSTPDNVPPTATLTPTPTRQPEAYLGQVVTAKIDPVIDIAPDFDSRAVADITAQHPWSGLLNWTETGATISGRSVAVGEAEELSFYTLSPNDPSGIRVRLFDVLYTDLTTRFPDDLIYFQGQRMEEILFWMVRRAAERGGQLHMTYDDFGIQQNLTIIGFIPFQD